jgi:hypothetical protein
MSVEAFQVDIDKEFTSDHKVDTAPDSAIFRPLWANGLSRFWKFTEHLGDADCSSYEGILELLSSHTDQ